MKTIQITDEQYELLEREIEHITVEETVVDLLAEMMCQYARMYGPDPSFTPDEAREAKDE